MYDEDKKNCNQAAWLIHAGKNALSTRSAKTTQNMKRTAARAGFGVRRSTPALPCTPVVVVITSVRGA